MKARRVLSQAPPVDNNQQAKKKRNNVVTCEERGNEKGMMKKREREKKTRVTPARGLLSILNEPRVALRDSTVGSCWLAIVITRCREHTRRGWTMASSHEESGTNVVSKRRNKTVRVQGTRSVYAS